MPQKAAGPTDGATGIRACGADDKPGGEGSAGTTARATRNVRNVPRIPGRQEAMAGQLEAERKLMGDEFPQEDSARLLPAPHTRRVVLGEPVGEEAEPPVVRIPRVQ